MHVATIVDGDWLAPAICPNIHTVGHARLPDALLPRQSWTTWCHIVADRICFGRLTIGSRCASDATTKRPKPNLKANHYAANQTWTQAGGT
jgi:hypothetical protein